jgi:transcriptional regulator with XRE-family HTH domain
MSTIGERIKRVRIQRRITQSALAELLNMSRQGISHWESNRTMPDAATLLQLSRILSYNFETDQPVLSEEDFQWRFSLAVQQEDAFPFVPEKITAVLIRDKAFHQADVPEDSPIRVKVPPLCRLSCNDVSVTAAECILQGRDENSQPCLYRMPAEIVTET